MRVEWRWGLVSGSTPPFSTRVILIDCCFALRGGSCEYFKLHFLLHNLLFSPFVRISSNVDSRAAFSFRVLMTIDICYLWFPIFNLICRHCLGLRPRSLRFAFLFDPRISVSIYPAHQNSLIYIST